MSLHDIKQVAGGREQSLVGNFQNLLAHEAEPRDTYQSFSPLEIKEELHEERIFLKHRVWRNMNKIRRSHQF